MITLKPLSTDNDKSKQNKYHRKSNGEGSIFQRSDGRWCAKIQFGSKDNGKPNTKCFYGAKRKDVVDKLENFKKEHGLIVDDIVKITVDVFISDWLKNFKSARLKPTSYDRLEYTINKNVIPLIGYLKLSELSTDQIQKNLINDMIKEEYSYSAIKKAYDAINGCLKYAIQTRKLSYNPAMAVEMPSSKNFNKKEIRWFNNEEIKKFENECIYKYKNGKFQYVLGYGMIFIMNTGLRIGEALALKWEDIDFKKKIVFVIKNVEEAKDRKSDSNKKVQTNQPTLKSSNGYRFVNLNNKAMNALKQLKKVRYWGEDSYILCTESGSQNKYHNFLRTFKSITRKAGLGDDYGPHVLRHTFATHLFAKGKRVEEVAALIGDDVVTVQKTYIHILDKIKAEDVKVLDDI